MAYIHTMRTLCWAPYIKYIVFWMYFVIYVWILGLLTVYITPLCSKSNISETSRDSLSINTCLILINIEYSYSFEHKYLWISNTRIFVEYSWVSCNHTRTNGSIDIGTCTNIRTHEYISWSTLIWALHWAPYIKLIISQVYSLIHSWILGLPMVYITPLHSNIVYLR
jgi:hypothetical protein